MMEHRRIYQSCRAVASLCALWFFLLAPQGASSFSTRASQPGFVFPSTAVQPLGRKPGQHLLPPSTNNPDLTSLLRPLSARLSVLNAVAGGSGSPTRKKLKSKSARTSRERQQGRNGKSTASKSRSSRSQQQQEQTYQSSTVQREQWDAPEKRIVPLRSVVLLAGVAAAAGTQVFRSWYSKRMATLMDDFVDAMMEAETSKRELSKAAFKYKPKLGLFSRTNMLREYLKAVFTSPSLSSSGIEAMDHVVHKLLPVGDKELLDILVKDVGSILLRDQDRVGLALLLFIFERILPTELAQDGLAPLRKSLVKILPVDLATYQFDLAKTTYKAEVKSLFERGERPYVAPEGYMVLGLKQEDAEEIYNTIRVEYEPEAREEILEKASAGTATVVRKMNDPRIRQCVGSPLDMKLEHMTAFRLEQQKMVQDVDRTEPPSLDEVRERHLQRVLGTTTESAIDSCPKFVCIRCRYPTVLMTGEVEETVFHDEYKCPSCGSGREFVIRQT